MQAKGLQSDTYHTPDWYAYAVAAKWLGVAPTEDIPIWWIDRALVAISAENKAQEQLRQHS